VLSAKEFAGILEAAVLAPSAENRHAFELHNARDRLQLYGNDAYRRAAWHHRFLAQISFGAVVENIVVRAAALGWRARVHPFPLATEPSLIADLSLAAMPSAPSSHDAAIATRHTNRSLGFAGPRLDESNLQCLRTLAENISGVSLTFFDSPAARSDVLRLVRTAETARFKLETLHRDLFSGVRFDVGWNASADTGLPPAALGVGRGARWMFAQLRRWPLMRMLTHFGVHHALGIRAGDLPCRLAPHLGLLATSVADEAGAFAVGRALERVWLEGESRGLALQPFAGAGLLARPEYVDVPAETSRRLRESWKHLTLDTPVMVFRLGHAQRPTIRAGRPQVRTFSLD
jgi:hypothetical protein